MTEDDLKQNLEKIHTTQMGASRISRNLNLDCEPVAWCKQQIIKAAEISRKGKNWYVFTDNTVITVNANSYTIITAHKKTGRERTITSD